MTTLKTVVMAGTIFNLLRHQICVLVHAVVESSTKMQLFVASLLRDEPIRYFVKISQWGYAVKVEGE